MRYSLLLLFLATFFMACNNQSKEKKVEREPDSVISDNDDLSINTLDTSPINNPVQEPADTLFSGLGTEPFWSIDVIEGKEIVFKTADGEEVRIPEYVGTTDEKGVSRYMAAKNRQTIVMSVTKKQCSDGMSDTNYDYEVIAVVNTVTYRGCGRYK